MSTSPNRIFFITQCAVRPIRIQSYSDHFARALNLAAQANQRTRRFTASRTARVSEWDSASCILSGKAFSPAQERSDPLGRGTRNSRFSRVFLLARPS